MAGKTPSSKSFALIIIATIAALILRSWVRVQLRQQGLADSVAADIAYLVVPVVLLALTFPIWRHLRDYAGALYCRADATLQVVIYAVMIGLLMRIAWWAHTVTRISFGWFTQTSESIGPSFTWQCPAPAVFALGILVMAVVVPLIEEIVHRGYIYRAMRPWGLPIALPASSLVFTLFHESFSWPVVFVAGSIFAYQFHRTGSLWPSTISHATYNLLVQFDWRCLRGRWQVADPDLPVLDTGSLAVGVLLLALVGILFVLGKLPETPQRLEH